jgi:hypothetical protein
MENLARQSGRRVARWSDEWSWERPSERVVPPLAPPLALATRGYLNPLPGVIFGTVPFRGIITNGPGWDRRQTFAHLANLTEQTG